MNRKWVYQFTDTMRTAWGLPLEVGKWYFRDMAEEGDGGADIYQQALYSTGPFDSREEAKAAAKQ